MPNRKTEDPRIHRLTIRMNGAEYEAFLQACNQAQLSAADLVRLKCCGREVAKPRRRKSLDRQALASALGQLGKIGGNINQVAHAMNIAKGKPDAAAVAATLLRFEEQITRIEAMTLETQGLIRQTLLQNDPEE